MMALNVEEMNLLIMFDTTSRTAAAQDILSRLSFVDNEEMREICLQTLNKLEKLTDEEFAALDFTVYEEEDVDE